MTFSYVKPTGLAVAFAALLGLINLGRGCLHVFLPDSGAGHIAGFDLSAGGPAIVFLLAMVGVTQIGLGLADLAAALRYRMLVLPMLWVHTAQQGLAMWVFHVAKPPPVAVPGEAFNTALAAVILLAALLETYAQSNRKATTTRVQETAE
jgi:hypothetical protein